MYNEVRKTPPVLTGLPTDMKKEIEWYAEKEHIEKTVAFRKILDMGLKEVRTEHAIEEYRKGKVTLWKASEMARLSLWEMIELIKEKGVSVRYTLKDVEADIRAVLDTDEDIQIESAVSNSTPLIYLAKIGKVRLLKELFEKVYIPEEVFEEVVIKGKELNKKEVFLLEELIEEALIEVKSAAGETKGIETLHKGEMAAISVAKDRKIKTLLTDDRKGLGAASVSGLRPIKTTAVLYSSRWQRQRLRVYSPQPIRTTAVLLMFYRNGIIDYKEFCDSLSMLSEEGYFITASVYAELVRRVKELK